MSSYLAHIAADSRVQSVRSHLEGTAHRAAQFAEPFDAAAQGTLAGMAHDIGKYSAAFQKRLQGSPKRTDHATAGAAECFKMDQVFAAFAVAGHHGGLPDAGSRTDTPDSATFFGRMNRAKNSLLPAYDDWKTEITLPPTPTARVSDPLRDMFFTRMLYSCLVDADFLDTEAFMDGIERERGGYDSIQTLTERLDSYCAGWFPPKTHLNENRCAILTQCREQGDVQKQGLFTLTVPTGGGKTTSSLAFALHHARAQNLQRIIYVVPYTSIIEQTAAIFRDILGAENVLEHHSGVLYETRDEATPHSIRLSKATENWDIPVVVTTAVEFFESLYANRSSRCRKLHNLAKSVILFDEAQMLPIPYLLPCVYAIAQLVHRYHVSAVLCTATQPALDRLFQKYLPEYPPIELCPEGVFCWEDFRRVTFEKQGNYTWSALAAQLGKETQVLCIVNTRKAAQAVFSQLPPDGSYHLSTLMYPAHRRAVLSEIRTRLQQGLPCRVVSTSLIEAGVDVDFPTVYREEAGLDSILQAAGRCNREGKNDASQSKVVVFKGEDKAPPLFSIPIGAYQQAMCHCDTLDSRDTIAFYFRELLELKGEAALDKKKILHTMQDSPMCFRTIAEEFHLIDSPTQTIYVPLEDGAALTARLRSGEDHRSLFRALGRYGVSVYSQDFAALEASGAIELLENGCAILTDVSLYSPETGLSLDADSGQALFV